MGRRRGPKFFFPIPGRKSHPKVDSCDRSDKSDSLSPIPSNTPIPPAPQWSQRLEEPPTPTYSKAQRILGTAGPAFRAPSKPSSVPPSPGYMSVTISEGGSQLDDKASSLAVGDGSFVHQQRPDLSNRASSNILPADMAYTDRRGSNCSSVSRQLNTRTSNSTMRSHYDAQKSPLAISQQTSDSAVRDMALRKGKPQIGSFQQNHLLSPLSHEYLDETGKGQKREKPPRLDLSKLFPKPKGNEKRGEGIMLLSPTKMVDSPTAMSPTSEVFPRPMTREPTPERGHAKLIKSKRQHHSSAQPVRSGSPVRLYKRDVYDSAKINIRRPPKGIQHWFEGFDDDSDDYDDDENAPAPPMRQPNPLGPYPAPVRKSSLRHLLPTTDTPKSQTHPSHISRQPSRASQQIGDPARQHMYANLGIAHPQLSGQSQSSLGTTKTKESALSKVNLQDSSVLSFSSSEEDEDEDESSTPASRKVSVRDSIDMNEFQGDIIIGQAHAMEVRQPASRRPSVGKLSLLSTSTNTATIEMIYTPEPYTPQRFPRTSGAHRRSNNARQPPAIPEDEGIRPQTASVSNQPPRSPSTHSIRTTMSEPRSRYDTQKLMAVTAEEMALLEALRKKRAAMAQQSWVEGYVSAVKEEEVRQLTPPNASKEPYRTSAFLSTDSLSNSPVRVVETKQSATRKKSLARTPAPLLVPSRGRSALSRDLNINTSMLSDSSSPGPRSSRQISPVSVANHLGPQPEFSPLDPFPSSPTQSASINSLTTTNHPSPIPSPITPRLRHGEDNVLVKVASSEPSCDDEDDAPALETGIIDPPTGSIKPDESHSTQHTRRRTASSGTDAPLALPAKPTARDIDTNDAPSRPGSIIEMQPRAPRKSAHRSSALSLATSGLTKSRHSSVASLNTASPHSQTERRRPASRVSSISSMKRDSGLLGSAGSRSSVSEDVLAAWGSLGGLSDYHRPRY